MSLTLRDPYLERLIERERVRRGHSYATQTVAALLNERLTEIRLEQQQQRREEVAVPKS